MASNVYKNKRRVRNGWSQHQRDGKREYIIANYPERICNTMTKVDRVITTCGKVDASLSRPVLYMWHLNFVAPSIST